MLKRINRQRNNRKEEKNFYVFFSVAILEFIGHYFSSIIFIVN